MKKLATLLVLWLAFCVAMSAQTFSLITGREPVTSLDGLWRFHTGDDPAWPDPNFDDSKWELIRSDQSWTKQGYFTYSGYAWYRFTVQVEDGSKPLGLLLPRIYTGYRVYGNGKLIGGSGSIIPTAAPAFAANPKLFRFVPGHAGPQSVQIAIRVWEYRPIVSWVGGGTLQPGSAAGDPALLAQRLDWLETAQRQLLVNSFAYGLLATVVGLTILTLFLLHREDREYIWFSVLLLAGATDAMSNFEEFSDAFPFLFFRLADEVLVAISAIAALLFFSTVFKMHRSFLWWIVCIASAVSPLSVAIYYLQWAPVGVSYSVQLFCLLPAYLWIIAALSIAFVRRDQSARLLLVPAALLYGVYIIDSIAYISLSLGWQQLPSGRTVLLQHPFPVDLLDVIRYIFILALLMFLVRRFSLARKEEDRFATEFEAARRVQQFLIPEHLPQTPGLSIQSEYRPANEVGGDFFQVLPDAADGSVLIVVGDVAGHGLEAGMLATLIVGAIRTAASFTTDPEKILLLMNERMHGRGLATCLALRIERDGHVALANAGHLPPYLNGTELEMEGALPLGAIPGITIPVLHFKLAEGDALMLMTDGVAEAQDAAGRLFGFERIGEMLRKGVAAAELATAAQLFGQEDDITVLSVRSVAASA